jgi:RNA polymerase sigma factor (sigma-70 family)
MVGRDAKTLIRLLPGATSMPFPKSDSPDVTDNELLMQFVRHRDEHAFGQLVGRHAPLVMGICRQISLSEQDAEDAFQATFLILTRRSRRLLHVSSLGGWLHRVAFRTALRTTQREVRRRKHPLTFQPAMNDASDPLNDIHLREMQRVLHEELQRLPTRYRDAIVLCDFEQTTRAQAARCLDCTESAIKAALARGRRQLRMRLLRRGFALSLALTVAQDVLAAVPIPNTVMVRTVELCTADVLGTSPSPSPPLESLTRQGDLLFTISRAMVVPAVASLACIVPLVLMALVGLDADTSTSSVVADRTEVVLRVAGVDDAFSFATFNVAAQSPKTNTASSDAAPNEAVFQRPAIVQVNRESLRGALSSLQEDSRTFNVTVDLTRTSSGADQTPDPNYRLRKRFYMSDNRLRTETEGEIPGRGSASGLIDEVVVATDTLSRSLDKRPRRGRTLFGYEGIDAAGEFVYQPVFWRFRPLDDRLRGIPINEVTISRELESKGGIKCVKVMSRDRTDSRRWWFDPSRRFVVVHYEKYIGPTLSIKVSNISYQAPSLKPVSWKVELYGADQTVETTFNCTVQSAEVGLDLDEDLYELAFPPGTVVFKKSPTTHEQEEFLVESNGAMKPLDSQSFNELVEGRIARDKYMRWALYASLILTGSVLAFIWMLRKGMK